MGKSCPAVPHRRTEISHDDGYYVEIGRADRYLGSVGSSNLRRTILAAALAGGLYFSLAIIALQLTRGADGIATVWPASGVAVAALLLAQPGQRRWVLLALGFASFLGNLIFSARPGLAFGLTCANVLEALIAFGVMRDIQRRNDSFFHISAILRFCLAAIFASVASATVASLIAGDNFGHMFLSWLTTVALGILIVVPLIMNFVHPGTSGPARGVGHFGLTALVLALVAGITAAVFAQSTYPLLFLPLLCVLFATYFLGATGATCSILTIAAIGSVAIWQGQGSISLTDGGTRVEVLFFQFYLFTLLVSALPLAALIAMRDRSFAEVERGKRWLEMSEGIAKVGHWRLELAEQRLFWSGEVFRIHGLEPGLLPSLDMAVNFYHPEDRTLVEGTLAQSLETLSPIEFEARIIRADGEIRYVYSCSEVELREDGKPGAIFGIFQDVTNRVLAAMELASARAKAEARADEAIHLAETDALTEIANRRKVMACLDTEIAKAAMLGGPLAIAVLDIDRFKLINDRFGHAVGDQVIRRVAQVCALAIRGADLVGRIGGEEFLIVLPSTEAEMAFAVAERVRRAVETIDWEPLDLPPVTVSIGLASSLGDVDCKELMLRADRALYQAKHDGRNLLRQTG
jgi:diguanylate cyclase (GGDEF)-like protein/PAS domain S-box-containing protein